jgi:glycosyltransferase involved in cell wall biosynthesis
MLFGPPVIEWLARRRGRVPLVLDLDDATYIAYDSPVYGRLARTLKWPGKTDALIAMANVVTCGNRVLADYAAGLGASTELVPTVVDTDRFVPRPTGEAGDPPVIGWIGNHDTFAYLEPLLPVLADVARRHSLRLRVVGSGRAQVTVPGVEVDNRQWRLETEVDDFQSLDVGLYPLADDARASGKSALKAIQYMAVGVPFVATPVGAAAQVGREGVTHLVATTPTEWRDALACLLADPALRRRLGDAGRRHALENWSLDRAAQPLAAALRRTALR